jgi:hypothetical protein
VTRTTVPAVLSIAPLAIGDHVGHRNRRVWRDHAPGTIASIDRTVSPSTYRIRPTRDRHWPEWEAPAVDLTRLGSAGIGLAYALGAGVRSTRPVDALAPNGTVHALTIRSAMIIDVYPDRLAQTRCRVLTDAGDVWDVAGVQLTYVAPWE